VVVERFHFYNPPVSSVLKRDLLYPDEPRVEATLGFET
jgi:hypothetical protein